MTSPPNFDILAPPYLVFCNGDGLAVSATVDAYAFEQASILIEKKQTIISHYLPP
jgi:hypothetical protein